MSFKFPDGTPFLCLGIHAFAGAGLKLATGDFIIVRREKRGFFEFTA